jgi:hypothetical protein
MLSIAAQVWLDRRRRADERRHRDEELRRRDAGRRSDRYQEVLLRADEFAIWHPTADRVELVTDLQAAAALAGSASDFWMDPFAPAPFRQMVPRPTPGPLTALARAARLAGEVAGSDSADVLRMIDQAAMNIAHAVVHGSPENYNESSTAFKLACHQLRSQAHLENWRGGRPPSENAGAPSAKPALGGATLVGTPKSAGVWP